MSYKMRRFSEKVLWPIPRHGQDILIRKPVLKEGLQFERVG